MFTPSVLAAATLAASPAFMDCAPCYLASLLLAGLLTARQGLLQTLQYLDPNGCWTDTLARQEGLEPCTMEDALAAYEQMMADNS